MSSASLVEQHRTAWYDARTGKQVDNPTDELHKTVVGLQEALVGVKEDLRIAMEELHKAFDGMKSDITTLQSSYADLLKKYEEWCDEKDRE